MRLKNKFILMIVPLVIISLSLGFSSYTTDLNIKDMTAIVRAQTDIRITNYKIESTTNESISEYESYNVNSISSDITLPHNNSTITYKINITNFGNTYMGIKTIHNLPNNLDYELKKYNIGDILCDINYNNKCMLGSTSELYLTIKYKSNGYSKDNISYKLNIFFILEEINMYQITYLGDEFNNSQTTIQENKNLIMLLDSDLADIKITTNNNEDIKYETYYENNNRYLKINNITSDLIVEIYYYIKVDYLQGDGTSYIDTGYIPDFNTRTIIDFEEVEHDIYMALYGARKSVDIDSFTLWSLRTNSYRYDYKKRVDSTHVYTTTEPIYRHTFEQNRNKAYIDGIELTPHEEAVFDAEYSMYMFSVNNEGKDALANYGTTQYSNYKGKIYNLKIYDNQTDLIRNYIPVYRKKDNEPGMYDLVENKFYQNKQNLTKYPNSKFTYGYNE